MKKLIVLPGNSQRNEVWGEQCMAHFAPWFDSVYLQRYDHWRTGAKDIDIEAELSKLAHEASDEAATYYIFAKSVGSLLALIATHRGLVRPVHCVFFGMPLELASNELFKDDWSPLTDFDVLSLAFHNDHDPISYPYTKNALEGHCAGMIELVTLKGDNHDYLDFGEYEETIKNFLHI